MQPSFAPSSASPASRAPITPQYLDHWLGTMKTRDKKAIFTAVSKASQAAGSVPALPGA